ncbi:hypothetical protein CLOM_g5227 [Closterium sp. NIES-68]|nr:hypothetical protein CLOM_g5227 [Closterium sp. NIES-68]
MSLNPTSNTSSNCRAHTPATATANATATATATATAATVTTRGQRHAASTSAGSASLLLPPRPQRDRRSHAPATATAMVSATANASHSTTTRVSHSAPIYAGNFKGDRGKPGVRKESPADTAESAARGVSPMKARGRRLRASLGDSRHLRSLAARSAAAALAAVESPTGTWGGEDGEGDGEEGVDARRDARKDGRKDGRKDWRKDWRKEEQDDSEDNSDAVGGDARRWQVRAIIPTQKSPPPLPHGRTNSGNDSSSSSDSSSGSSSGSSSSSSRHGRKRSTSHPRIPIFVSSPTAFVTSPTTSPPTPLSPPPPSALAAVAASPAPLLLLDPATSHVFAASSAAASVLGMTRGELEGARFVSLVHGVHGLREEAWVHALGAAVLTKGLMDPAENGNGTQSDRGGDGGGGGGGGCGGGDTITLRFRLAPSDRGGALVGQRVRLDIRLPPRPVLPSTTLPAAAAVPSASGPDSSNSAYINADAAPPHPPPSPPPPPAAAAVRVSTARCSFLESPPCVVLSAPLLASLTLADAALPPAMLPLRLAAPGKETELGGVADWDRGESMACCGNKAQGRGRKAEGSGMEVGGGGTNRVNGDGGERSGECRGNSNSSSRSSGRQITADPKTKSVRTWFHMNSAGDGMSSTRRRRGSLSGRQVDLSPRCTDSPPPSPSLSPSPSPSPGATCREGVSQGRREERGSKGGREGKEGGGVSVGVGSQRTQEGGGGIPEIWRKVVGERHVSRKGGRGRGLKGAGFVVGKGLGDGLRGGGGTAHEKKQEMSDEKSRLSLLLVSSGRKKQAADKNGVDVTRPREHRGSMTRNGAKPCASIENWTELEEFSADGTDMGWFC